MKINYPLAISNWDQNEINAILKTIVSDQYSMGEKVKTCENDFSKFIGSKYCVMVNSGSSANLLAIAALRYRKLGATLKPGDEVIVPAVSWSTTYYPLYQYGLKIRYVDVDINTLNIDVKQLKEAITPQTKAVFLVHLLGNPVEMEEVVNICNENNLILLEDTCESLGAKFNNRHCGTFGVLGTFSSFFSHHISTMEGGFVVTDDEEVYHILLALRAHGWTRNLPENNLITKKSSDSFVESFRFILPGYNLRPLEMSGAIGSVQIEKLPSFIEMRRSNADHFISKVKESESLLLQRETDQSSWFGFSILTKQRSKIIDELASENVVTRPIVAGNFAKNPVNEYFDYSVYGNLENSERVDKEGLFIGNHHIDVKDKLSLIANLLNEAH